MVSIDREAGEVRIEHASVAGLLESGTHDFTISSADLALLEAGDLMRGQAIRYGDGHRVEHVFRLDPRAESKARMINGQLRRETVAAGSRVFRGEGDFMPGFAFFNQDSELVTGDSLKGTAVLMNFIFTRCGMPEMCPASTQRMTAIQQKLKEEGIDGVRLVTVSFDPSYDTPGILRQYAESRGIEFGNFDLLTGDPQAIDDLMRTFGIFVRGDGPMRQHTMATLLFDENGKIVYRKEGSRWSVEEFMERIRRLRHG